MSFGGRYCTTDAYFCVKEVDLAITADMGTLQRLPGIVGEGARPKLIANLGLPDVQVLCASSCTNTFEMAGGLVS